VSNASDNLVFRNLLCCVTNAQFGGGHLHYRCLSEAMIKQSEMAPSSQNEQQTI